MMSFDLTSHYVKHVNCTYSNTTISSMTTASTEMSYLQGSELQALLSLPMGCLGGKIFKQGDFFNWSPETSTGSEFLSLLRISEFFRFI